MLLLCNPRRQTTGMPFVPLLSYSLHVSSNLELMSLLELKKERQKRRMAPLPRTGNGRVGRDFQAGRMSSP